MYTYINDLKFFLLLSYDRDFCKTSPVIYQKYKNQNMQNSSKSFKNLSHVCHVDSFWNTFCQNAITSTKYHLIDLFVNLIICRIEKIYLKFELK